MTGRVGLAAQNICYAKETVNAGKSCPDNGVDLFVVLEFFELKRVVRVDEHDDLGTVLFCQLDHVFLVLGQSQRTLEGIAFRAVEHRGLVIGRFGVVSRDHADRCRSVRGGQHLVCVHGSGDLTYKVNGRLLPGRLEGRHKACAGEEGLTCVGKRLFARQKADHLLIELESLGEHGVDQVYVLLSLACCRRGADHTAARGKYAVVSPKRYGLRGCVQRKSAVVLEKNRAFRRDLLGQLCFGSEKITERIKFGFKIVTVPCCLSRFFQPVADCSESGIDERGTGRSIGSSHKRYRAE